MSLEELVGRSELIEGALVGLVGNQRGIRGELPCPGCRAGTVHYRVTESGWRIHAGCDNPDCVPYMGIQAKALDYSPSGT